MSETTVSAGVHLCNFARPTINCETQASAGRPEGYPVLHVGPVAFWPTPDQLRTLRDAINAWLASPDGIRLSEHPRTNAAS